MTLEEKLDVLRRAGRLLKVRGRLPQVKQAEELRSFSNDDKSDLHKITPSEHTWGRFLLSTGAWMPKQKDFDEVVWLWLEKKHQWALEEALSEAANIGAIQSNDITTTLYRFLYPTGEYPRQALKRIDGKFLMVRPFFVDSSRFMVSTLSCDADKARFICEMDMIDDEGNSVRETAEGAIVPYENRFLFIGAIPTKKAPFIFILADCVLGDEEYTKAEGTIMVGAPAFLPNASALIIRRTDIAYEGGIFSKEEMENTFPYWPDIASKLNRGFVEWK